MKVEVRYYSRSGNTKALADTIAKGANVKAISITEKDSLITEDTDILFIGGALYAYGLDAKLKKYIADLDVNKIKQAIVFSTSWLSKHSIYLLKKELEKKNISVKEEYLYFKNMPNEEELKQAEEFAKKYK